MESSIANLILRKQMVKGRIVGHRCGACHKASNAKVRMARMRNEVLGYQCVQTRVFVPFVRFYGYIYRCLRFLSSRWCCLNGGFISVSITPLQGVNGEIFLQRYEGSSLSCNALPMIGDRWPRPLPLVITSWTNLGVTLIHCFLYGRGYDRDYHSPHF